MKYGSLPKHSTGGKDSRGPLQPSASLHFTVKSIHSSTSICEVQFWNTLTSQNYMKNHSGWTLLKGKTRWLLREGLLEQPNLWRKSELNFYIILLWKPQTGGKCRQNMSSPLKLIKQNSWKFPGAPGYRKTSQHIAPCQTILLMTISHWKMQFCHLTIQYQKTNYFSPSLLRFSMKYKDGAQHYHYTLCLCFLWVGCSQVFGRPIHNGKYLIFKHVHVPKVLQHRKKVIFMDWEVLQDYLVWSVRFTP